MPILLAILAAAAAAPPPLTPPQAEQVRCVAALAIVANGQQQGSDEWAGVPPLGQRGAHFAGVAGEALMKQTGRTREGVRDAILAEIAAFQKAGSVPRATVNQCVALMDRTDPPPTPPGRSECAALLAVARDETKAREGLSPTVKDLTAFASVVDARAREALREEGKTMAEADIVIGLARERIEADAKAGRDLPDLTQCLEFAKP